MATSLRSNHHRVEPCGKRTTGPTLDRDRRAYRCPSTRESSGTRMVPRMLNQANGEMRFDWRPAGLSCEIVIPT